MKEFIKKEDIGLVFNVNLSGDLLEGETQMLLYEKAKGTKVDIVSFCKDGIIIEAN